MKLDNHTIEAKLYGTVHRYLNTKLLQITATPNPSISSRSHTQGNDLIYTTNKWDENATPILVLQCSIVPSKGWHLQLFSQNRGPSDENVDITYVQMGRKLAGINKREMGLASKPKFVGVKSIKPAKIVHQQNGEPVEQSEDDDDENEEQDRREEQPSRPREQLSIEERRLLSHNAAGTTEALRSRRARGSSSLRETIENALTNAASADHPEASNGDGRVGGANDTRTEDGSARTNSMGANIPKISGSHSRDVTEPKHTSNNSRSSHREAVHSNTTPPRKRKREDDGNTESSTSASQPPLKRKHSPLVLEIADHNASGLAGGFDRRRGRRSNNSRCSVDSRPCNHPSIGLANLAMTSINTLYAIDGWTKSCSSVDDIGQG
jgi:hypothetical protein